ncbi:neutral cholesterol ester hydrolase 1a [Brienomyrus brachyistius]|uniref:neutral cholesterol ester hydrolase 1a n=1 Tax=Brienomyrus brachyistius TaxID=42636 RepID=UPI0020B3EEA5|nr:neutral cholesterol ester hydrolase 1a [Brienomyrus brachyistius]
MTMKRLFAVTLILTIGFAYYIYIPLPSTVSEPWKLMLVAGTFRAVMQMGTVAHTLGLIRDIDVLSVVVGTFGLLGPESSENLRVSDTVFAGVEVRVYQSTLREVGELKRGVVYIHGGGWALGSTRSGSYDLLCRKLAEDLDAVVVSVEYRLAPGVHFPVPYDDVLQASRHFLRPEVLTQYSVDPDRVAVSGDSAGGNLAAAVAQQVAIDDSIAIKFKVQALIYPVLQALDFNTPSYQENQNVPMLHRTVMVQFWLKYLAADPEHLHALLLNNHTAQDQNQVASARAKVDWVRLLPPSVQKQYKPVVQPRGSPRILEEVPALLDPRASPLLAEPDILAQVPQAYILTCEHDVLRDDGLMYGLRLQEAGVTVTQDHYVGGFHGCVTFAFWPTYFSVGMHSMQNYIAWLDKNL